MQTGRFISFGILISLTAISLTGCRSYIPPEQLAVGDCFQADRSILGNDQPAAQVEKKTCTTAHNSEVIGRHHLPEGNYPGPSEIARQADQLCREDFKKYTGEDLAESRWDVYPLSPTETSWRKGNERMLTCVALTLPEQTRSLKK